MAEKTKTNAPVNVASVAPAQHALKFIRKRASLPPLGLLTVAAMLPRERQQRVVDLNVRTLTDGDLAWADLVCIVAMIAQRDSTERLIARCRAAGKTIIAGGPLFTSASAEAAPAIPCAFLSGGLRRPKRGAGSHPLTPARRNLRMGSA